MSAGAAARHRVVIVGAGFGGLEAALGLRRAPVELIVIDRRNFHLFQPLLYQVATGGLSPGDIACPIRWVLRKQRGGRVVLGEVDDLDPSRRCVRLRDGEEIGYDTLVVATGASHHYFGNDNWRHHAPGLKTVEDALEMRQRIFYAFEAAERELDSDRRRAWLTFVVVGAGPTGVELAGALSELANDTLPSDFRTVDPSEARILLVEATDRVLPGYPEGLSLKAKRSLERLGVRVHLGAQVCRVDADGVELEVGDARERISSKTVLWAAGVRSSPFGDRVAAATSAQRDRNGRLRVEPDCSLAGHPEIFVIGDLAHLDQDGTPLPGVAPVAKQQGRYVAQTIRSRLRGRKSPAFRYRDRGSLATIGRSAAVADFGRVRFSGLPAWLLWLGVHILFLVGFENRILVLIQWAFSYTTRNRGARLITGESMGSGRAAGESSG